jgi:hypothetical protein
MSTGLNGLLDPSIVKNCTMIKARVTALDSEKESDLAQVYSDKITTASFIS